MALLSFAVTVIASLVGPLMAASVIATVVGSGSVMAFGRHASVCTTVRVEQIGFSGGDSPNDAHLLGLRPRHHLRHPRRGVDGGSEQLRHALDAGARRLRPAQRGSGSPPGGRHPERARDGDMRASSGLPAGNRSAGREKWRHVAGWKRPDVSFAATFRPHRPDRVSSSWFTGIAAVA